MCYPVLNTTVKKFLVRPVSTRGEHPGVFTNSACVAMSIEQVTTANKRKNRSLNVIAICAGRGNDWNERNEVLRVQWAPNLALPVSVRSLLQERRWKRIVQEQVSAKGQHRRLVKEKESSPRK